MDEDASHPRRAWLQAFCRPLVLLVLVVTMISMAALGGWFMTRATTPSTAWIACALAGLALVASLWARRLARR